MPKPETLLFRSHIEIVRIMQVLAQQKCKVTALLKAIHPFTSFIIHFDPDTERFAIDYSPRKHLNELLLESPGMEFTATDRVGLNFSFIASAPEETMVNGAPAIRFLLPKEILMHNRREHARLQPMAPLSLRCVADEGGFAPFESRIVDVSHDGLGCILYDATINLAVGTVLHGSRIVIPGGDAVISDMELRHIATVKMPDGILAHRAGFRFARKNGDLAKLVQLFIQDMDKK